MQRARLDRQLIAVARANAACRLTMSAPGIGALAALSCPSENPATFKNSRAVGAYAGLVARGQSGEIGYAGRISKRGGKRVRSARFTKRRFWS